MNIFDILGPVMIGPSSSHTAGAVRIGRVVRAILGECPVKADIFLHGSFAETYRGHGTDRALAGGLLGLSPADEGVRDSLNIAAREGISLNFHKGDLGDVHPNTAKIVATGVSGKSASITASSVGGGRIRVIDLLGYPVDFEGQFNTLIITHEDKPGTVGGVTKVLGGEGINIAYMRVSRERPGAQAIMIIETDQACDGLLVEKVKALSGILTVAVYKPV